MKVNKPGLNLRKKSSVHASIIDVNTGRRKSEIRSSVSERFKKSFKEELWPFNGSFKLHPLLKHKFTTNSNNLIEKFNFKRPVDVFVLGPGKGIEVLFFKEYFKNSNIDTLGLSNNLNDLAKKMVRQDFSPKQMSFKQTFEHLNHLKFVRKYDYVFSSFGPLTHTRYPEVVLLKVASMLRPGGIAEIFPVLNVSASNLKQVIKNYDKKNEFLITHDKFHNLLILERRKEKL